MHKDHSFKGFRKQLEKHHDFPDIYIFKFIIPALKIDSIKRIFPDEKIIYKPSKNGNYIGVTAKIMMVSADDVIDIYKQTSQIEGIIQL